MRKLLEIYNNQFAMLDANSRLLLAQIPENKLFQKPRELNQTMTMFSCGEYVLRSAAAVEQTFGGIMTKLWDDPFEWTLPEELFSTAKILNYLSEVEATRGKGFNFFASDNDLVKQIPAPEKIKTIHEILLETIVRAAHFQGRAFAVFQMIDDCKLPRLK